MKYKLESRLYSSCMQQPNIFWSAVEARQAFYDGKFIVHNEHPSRHFLVFADPDHFLQYQEGKPAAERCFHEVMYENAPRRLYIDIDSESITKAQTREVVATLTDKFKAAVVDYFKRGVDWRDLVRISSCGHSASKNKYKFSLHFRLPTIIADPAELREFARVFAAGLADPAIVDLGVYKSYQTMRMLGSTKMGDTRNSAALDRRNKSIENFYNSIIGWCPQAMVVNVVPVLPPAPVRSSCVELAPAEVRAILEKTAQHYAGYAYRCTSGSRVYFDRIDPPVCPICQRQHHSDNALFMKIYSDYVALRCHRDADRREIKILDL